MRSEKLPPVEYRIVSFVYFSRAAPLVVYTLRSCFCTTNTPTGMSAASGAKTGREKALQPIIESVNKALSLESWGMPVEAMAEFMRCNRQLTIATVGKETFTDLDKELLLRIARLLEMKANSLQNPVDDATGPVNAVDVADIPRALQDMMEGDVAPVVASSVYNKLPAATIEHRNAQKARSLFLSDDDYSLAIKAMGKGGTLFKRKQVLPGKTYLTITIDKIGMKDSQSYIDPLITITTLTQQGTLVETQQDTPVTTKQREVAYIPFDVDVDLSTPIEEIPQGSAIFFEFKHFKPKKQSISVKCFSFMEMDEIKPGKKFLEIYKKPTDFSRKKLSLLSVKPLYLHVTLTLSKT